MLSCCFEGRRLARRENTIQPVHLMEGWGFPPLYSLFFSPYVPDVSVPLCRSSILRTLTICRAHSVQPSLRIICSLLLHHQCTVHSAGFHAGSTHADPWDVSASFVWQTSSDNMLFLTAIFSGTTLIHIHCTIQKPCISDLVHHVVILQI